MTLFTEEYWRILDCDQAYWALKGFGRPVRQGEIRLSFLFSRCHGVEVENVLCETLKNWDPGVTGSDVGGDLVPLSGLGVSLLDEVVGDGELTPLGRQLPPLQISRAPEKTTQSASAD